MVGRKKPDNQLTEDEQTRLFGFRAAHVFDISQTEAIGNEAAQLTVDKKGGAP